MAFWREKKSDTWLLFMYAPISELPYNISTIVTRENLEQITEIAPYVRTYF